MHSLPCSHVTFHHHGDFSGDVILSPRHFEYPAPEEDVRIPAVTLLEMALDMDKRPKKVKLEERLGKDTIRIEIEHNGPFCNITKQGAIHGNGHVKVHEDDIKAFANAMLQHEVSHGMGNLTLGQLWQLTKALISIREAKQ